MMSDLNLRPVKPVRLFEQVAEQLQSLIVEGQLQPGDRLPSESELGAAHGVSRSVVREALRALESKGLIQVRSGAGASVASRPFSFSAPGEAIEWLLNRRDSLMQLLQLRESVEGLTASLAASSRSDDLLEELRQVVQQQQELSGSLSNLDSQVELDVRFHTLIADASGNDIAEEIVSRIVPAFCDSNRVVLYLQANMEQTLEEHHHIIDALASGEPAKAEAAMRAHIARVRSEIKNLLPEGDAPNAGKEG
jgi:GntR family transcriptional repressor for pyruvate dehydrogenase complex